jgi:cytochrome c oxidase cbb3-type subunit 2
MIDSAVADLRAQGSIDDPGAADLAKRYPKVNARDFDGNPKELTEADALIAYMQMLGTLVDFKTYDNKANLR